MAVACAAAALASCGGGKSASTSATEHSGAWPGEKRTGTRAQPSDRSHSQANSAKPSGGAEGAAAAGAVKTRSHEVDTGNRAVQHGSAGTQVRSKSPGGAARCPAAMTRRQCLEAGESYEQAVEGGSHTIRADECPRTMSRRACREAGEALQQADEGHVNKANECPAAMTDQQCAEAGRAYREAVK